MYLEPRPSYPAVPLLDTLLAVINIMSAPFHALSWRLRKTVGTQPKIILFIVSSLGTDKCLTSKISYLFTIYFWSSVISLFEQAK